MKARSKTLIKVGIIAVGMCDTGSGATNGAMASIIAAMPDVPQNLVQMIQSVPALFIALLPFVYALLVSSGFPKRRIIVIGGILLVLGGVMPTFVHPNIWVILFWRMLFGAGNGLMLPLASDLVIDFFDGHEKNVVQGWASAAFSLSGIVFQLLGGWLCEIDWTLTFLAYSVAIVFLLIALACIPEPSREQGSEKEKASLTGQQFLGGIPAEALVFIVVYGLFELCWYVNANNAALVIAGEGLASPALIGAMMSSMSLAALILGIIFGWVLKKIRYKTFLLGFAFALAGFAMNYLGSSAGVFVGGIFLIGCAQGFITPTAIAFLTNHLPYSIGSKVISGVYMALGIGGFLQPIVFGLFGSHGVGRSAYLIGECALCIIAILMFLACRTLSRVYKDRTFTEE